jgi:hypothetical protein
MSNDVAARYFDAEAPSKRTLRGAFRTTADRIEPKPSIKRAGNATTIPPTSLAALSATFVEGIRVRTNIEDECSSGFIITRSQSAPASFDEKMQIFPEPTHVRLEVDAGFCMLQGQSVDQRRQRPERGRQMGREISIRLVSASLSCLLSCPDSVVTSVSLPCLLSCPDAVQTWMPPIVTMRQ